MTYEEILKDKITFIMKHCGSDARERQVKGSKLKVQTDMLIEFIVNLNAFWFDEEREISDETRKIIHELLFRAKLQKG